MNYIIEKIGKEKPTVAIVGCLHGDEIIGKKVIEELKKIKNFKKSILLVLANKSAIEKNKRFVECDLNRSFPGKKNGKLEEKTAYELMKELKGIETVIDIHATNSSFNELIIVNKRNKEVEKNIKLLPIKKVAIIKNKVFQKSSLIAYSKVGISIEYGPNKKGKNYKKALKHIKSFLINKDIIKGKCKKFSKKTYFNTTEAYYIEDSFIQKRGLKNFKKIKEGEIIGKNNKKKIRSPKTFYPVFLGKGKYKKTLSLISEKIK